MRVAIIGSGGIGRGYAAYLSSAGHQPILWSPSGAALVDFAGGAGLTVTGTLEGTLPLALARDCAEAVDGADAVIVAVQANGFRAVFEALAPQLRARQGVIVSAHCSFAALHLHRLLAARGLDLPIAAWATTALTARKSGPRGVHVSGIRARLDVATLPQRHAEAGLALCRALFGDRFEPRPDVLAIMLSNLNPPAHMATMLGNLTRAEQGEDWPNYGSITQGVGRIIDAMDAERLSLARAFGLEVRSVQDHYRLSFGVEPGPVGEMAAAVYRKRPELLGPKSLDTRFITEDVPFGLVPLDLLGAIAGMELPLHRAGIALFDAICARDFRAENDLLPALGLAGLTPAELHRQLREG
ncbi:NAD/NADP octopine/nopaline dehydrogenase family protein [Bosea sp. CS1GBMeth4]|uniref:NAD/NADP-dependent octopine/nopaline dehydrogenase family protein n=1 Tax=Bosea sp. CS1GBMeth4 TaxID=1892849 RepID=UPI001646CD7B|nr:NAD/NADP octopine/nopaline dehydrogenase family protein [Bosea sp. CS1GBMeth4]